MYKWCRPGAIHHSFQAHRNEKYSFPPGWGRKQASFENHLQAFNDDTFDGQEALEAALQWKQKVEKARSEQKAHAKRQAEYAAAHRPVPTPSRKRLRLLQPDPLPVTSDADTDSENLWCATSDSDNESEDIEFSTPAGRVPAPAFTRGAMVPYYEQVEATEANERFSHDRRKQAEALLGVAADADLRTLKKAFRLKALDVHPDKVGAHHRKWATAEMQRVNEAFSLLSAGKS